MTDPVLGRRATHKNVTIQRLPSYLSAGPDSDLSDHITFAVERAKFAKLYRDKLIAHSDDDAMNGRVSVLQGSRADMREAMDAIATCIKRFALVELGTSLVTHPITKADDEVWFLQHLFEGVKAMESKKVRYQELLRAGRHAEAKALNSYPDWLNFRPKRITDVD